MSEPRDVSMTDQSPTQESAGRCVRVGVRLPAGDQGYPKGTLREPDHRPTGRASPTSATLLLGAMAVVSVGFRTLAAWRVETPWISPDEIVYALLGRSLWEDGELSILSSETGFYSLLYPAFVGGPLSLAGADMGHRIVQFLQAAVLSATAVPIYLWGRRLAGERWALAAAALFLALPVLGYSALIMSETLFLPLTTLALWALARALETPTLARQALLGVALLAVVSTRLQAVVFIPVVVTAVVVKSALDGSAHVLRRFAPALLALGVLTIAAALAGPDVLGGYAAAAEGAYNFGAAARYVAYHAAGVMLLSGIVPALGLTLVCVAALRKREQSAPVRAFVAVAVAYLPWLTLEVGIFASREVGHIAGRDLATAAPITLLGFAIWLSRGGLRPQPLGALLVLLFTAALVFVPVRPFAELRAIHDVLELVPLEWVRPDARELVFALAIAMVVLTFTLIRPNRVWLLAPLTFLSLMAGSAAGSWEAGTQSHLRENSLLGGTPTWVDDASDRGTAYLYAPEFFWPVVWQHLFWNRSIDRVWTMSDAVVPGPLPQTPVAVRADGRLVGADGVVVDAAAVVAPSSVALRGERVATIRQKGELRAADLGLWRSRGPARLSSHTEGVSAEGDVASSATVTVFDCRQGRLEVALIGKRAGRVSVLLDERVQRVVPLRAGDLLNASIDVTPSAGTDGTCVFELRVDGSVEVRKLTFVRGASRTGTKAPSTS